MSASKARDGGVLEQLERTGRSEAQGEARGATIKET